MKKFYMKFVCIAGFAFSLCSFNLYSQNASQVRIMCWNLLNFPSTSNAAADSATRCPYYREVVNWANPDILITEENSTTYSTTWFLSQVMNASGNAFSQGTFIRSYDSSNGIFFRDSLFRFVSNVPITTDLRDISEFTLVHLASGDTLRIYAVHLKASSGSSNEAQREVEVDSLRNVTNRFRPGTEFMVCGDFNIYGDQETCYQKLLQDNLNDDGNFRDPLTMPGTWNNSAYSNFHTQSTRLNSFGGGAYGGMNDRFDMILMSNGVMADTGVYFIPGTYTPVGNDGQHFDQSINYGTNSAVPATVANSLYLASDHLPVYADFQVGSTSGINETVQNLSTVDLYPNPVAQHAFLNCRASKAGKVRISLFNSVGQEVQVFANQFIQPGAQRIQLEIDSHLSSGFYLLSIMNDNQFIYKKLSLLR